MEEEEEYAVGDGVDVRDGDSKWCAKILEISNGSALVHFLKFNARHDEWIPLGRLKPRRTPMAAECSAVSPGESKDFKVGERVMAPWKYGRKYPGVVLGREHRGGGYKVKFYDGVTVTVKPSTMRYLRKDEMNDDEEEGSNTPSNPAPTTEGRRERKSKFNIKDLLSVRRNKRRSRGKGEEGGDDNATQDQITTPIEAPQEKQEDDFKKPGKAAAETSTTTEASRRKTPKSKADKKVPSSSLPAESKKEVKSSNSASSSKRVKEPKKQSNKIDHQKDSKKGANNSSSITTSSQVVQRKAGGDVSKNGPSKSASSSISAVVKKTCSADPEKENSVKKSVKQRRSSSSDSSKSAEVMKSPGKETNEEEDSKSSTKIDELPASVSVSESNGGGTQVMTSALCDSEDVKKSSSGSEKVNGKTPRITEPLLKDGPPLTLVTGKRARKRKKFWDEEESSATPSASSGPPHKVSKRSSDVSSRRESSSSSKSSTPVSSKSSSSKLPPAKGRFKTEADVLGSNGGRKLEYLLFDMTLEPKLIAKQMVEGLNIPGPGEPIPVDSSNLPDGWEKRVIQRGLGVTRGKWDVFIQNAAGKSFRSKTELQKHFDENNLSYSLDSFDFSLDDNLKRLRQIWKQFVIKPNLKPGEKLFSSTPLVKGCSSRNKSKGQTSSSKKDSVLTSLNTNLPSYHPRVSSSSEVSPPGSPGIVSETGQGLRCKINKCGKLFRNDKLLLMHVKHYHPQFSSSDSLPPVSILNDEPPPPPEPPTTKKLKTLLPEVVASASSSPSRKRNNSSLSLGSTDGVGEHPFMKRKSSFEADSNNSEDAVCSSSAGAEHLTSEEVVNCTCGRPEEDGLMIQCDVCLCWQHGACLGILHEEQVPDKHVCAVCKSPPGGRHPSSSSIIDQDLLKEGRMAALPHSSTSSRKREDEERTFVKLSDLMSDLLGLNKILHSLRVKISVAHSSKVFMWSSPWNEPHGPPELLKDEMIVDPSLIPSVSEVQELLPSIIEAAAEGLLSPPPAAAVLPEPPKRIDKDESRGNLIQHIQVVQLEVEERLNTLEASLASLEAAQEDEARLSLEDALTGDCAKTKALIQMLLMDLSTGKRLLGSL